MRYATPAEIQFAASVRDFRSRAPGLTFSDDIIIGSGIIVFFGGVEAVENRRSCRSAGRLVVGTVGVTRAGTPHLGGRPPDCPPGVPRVFTGIPTRLIVVHRLSTTAVDIAIWARSTALSTACVPFVTNRKRAATSSAG